MSKIVDPLKLLVQPGAEDYDFIQNMLNRRRSLRELPRVEFYPTPHFEGQIHNDLYGEFPVGLFVLDRGVLFGAYGLFTASTGELLIEQNAGIESDFDLAKAHCSAHVGKAEKVEIETVDHILSLVSVSCYCFYHWMMDCLPKLILAEMTGYKGKYLVPPPHMNPWVSESAHILEIDENRLIMTKEFVVCAEKLYIPTYFAGFHNRDHWQILEYYRRKVLKICSPKSRQTSRLFVPRKPNAKGRRILNQEQVSRLLKRYDFEEVYFEDLRLGQQIELAANADFLIAPHGSGMVHTLFMREGSTIIELFPFNGSSRCYEVNMEFMHHQYHAEFSALDCGSDIQVDVGKLENLLEKVTGTSRNCSHPCGL